MTWRAATTGATSSATMRIAPTVRTPSTTASASSPVLTTSTAQVGTPATAVKPGSNVALRNSRNPTVTTVSATAPNTSATAMSRSVIPAACPSR